MEPFKEAFYRKYPGNHKIIEYYEEANGCECTWENFSKVRLQRYVEFLHTKISPNSVKVYTSRIKCVMTMYNEEVLLPKDYEKVLLKRRDASQHVYLNNDEIKQIIDYEPQITSEAAIKNWFLIGCLTGARHSDYIRFTKSNIHDDELHYVSIKTHTPTILPLSPFVKRLILENEEKGYNDLHYSDVYFNRALRKICRKAGINEEVTLYTSGKFRHGEKWEFVASHCARRSFATNLYRKGVDIFTISRLCGHSSVDMTKQYICCGPVLDDTVLDYFNSYK